MYTLNSLEQAGRVKYRFGLDMKNFHRVKILYQDSIQKGSVSEFNGMLTEFQNKKGFSISTYGGHTSIC